MTDLKKVWEYYHAGDLVHYEKEINQENRKAIRLMATAGIPLGIANVFAQVFIAKLGLFNPQSSLMLLLFVALFFFDRCILPDDYAHATALLYLIDGPLMIAAIFLGTVLDPDHYAITVLILMMAMPVFILDSPIRILCVSAVWTVLFLVAAYFSKPVEIFQVDLIHVAEFFLAAWAEAHIILRVRFEALRGRRQILYNLEHDELTDLLNRRALTNRAEEYLGKSLVLILGDLDQLAFVNDFYGHEVGNQLLTCFCGIMSGQFGKDQSYRYGGDEMLCVMEGGTEQDCLERLEQCRKQLKESYFKGKKLNASCSFGYVMGTPATVKEFQEMIQLADIYVHKANRDGRDQTLGGPFDAQHLRAGIVESNIFTHARSYETNQLTGLPSMSYFIARTDELFEHIVDLNQRPVVGYFNVVQFRSYNDAFGYAQGDELIRDIAQLLRKAFPNRILCYISGSQFGVMCYQHEVEPGMEQVRTALLNYRPGFQIQCKLGLAEYTGSESAISLVDRAKAAQSSIRKDRTAFIRYYDHRLSEEERFRQYLVGHLDDALKNDELTVYYQPIARTLTGKVCNEEALSRWNDPEYGFLNPHRFIPVLEENRLIYKLTLHVVRRVLYDFARRKKLGVPIVPVSVNLSRHDFEQCDILNEITSMVDDSGFSRNLLKIEVTESAFVENQEMLKREVSRFRQNGFEVWMDDFGSEYSTLNLLQEMEFDLIKIDMQFMKNFSDTGRNGIIVSDIIDMARKMGITTLVEGVETIEQYRSLQKMGCEKVQGFLFNKPNSFDYIAQRFFAKNGLTFEGQEEAPYYADIAQIDLNAPFNLRDRNNGFDFTSEIPSGILESRNGELNCIRGTAHFFRRMKLLGMIRDSGTGVEQSAPLCQPLPFPLQNAGEQSETGDDWKTYIIEAPTGKTYSFYLRRISYNPATDCTAFLAVLLGVHTD